MKTIMITGASGFIGKHLTKRYLEAGDKVYAVVRTPQSLNEFSEYKNLNIVTASFEDFDKLADICDAKDIDIFYYLAWGGYGKSTNNYVEQSKNIKPVCDAVNAASVIGCKRFLFASSFSEYMIDEGEALSHSAGAHCNVYGAAKNAARVMAHAVAAQKKIEFLSVAFANTYGVGDTSHRATNIFVDRCLKGFDIDLTDGNYLYDWNYIDDTLEGLIAAGEKGKADSVYYVGNNYQMPLKDIVRGVRDILNPNVKIRLGTYKESFHLDYTSIDVNKLYNDTGYRAKCDFKDCILKTAEWVKKLNW